jgi:hypothetical protein
MAGWDRQGGCRLLIRHPITHGLLHTCNTTHRSLTSTESIPSSTQDGTSTFAVSSNRQSPSDRASDGMDSTQGRRVHVLSRGHRALLVPEAGVGEPAIKCGWFRWHILHGEARARFQGAAVVSRDAGHDGQHARQDLVAQVDGRSSGGRVDNAIDSTFLLIPPATSTYVGESMRMLPARPWYDAMCTVFAVRRQHTSMGPQSLGWKPKGRQRPPLQSPAPRSFCSRRRAS